MYADTITPNMREAIEETNRRRAKQISYNEERGIDPQPLRKKMRRRDGYACPGRSRYSAAIGGRLSSGTNPCKGQGSHGGTSRENGRCARPHQLIEDLTAQMHAAAEQLQFELAARYRDEIKGLKSELWHSQQAQK